MCLVLLCITLLLLYLIHRQAALISLCPEGMPALLSDNNRGSEQPQSKQQKSNFPAKPEPKPTGKEASKKAEADLENSVSSRVDTSTKLEQDSMEGVDEKEWVKSLESFFFSFLFFQNTVGDLNMLHTH